MAINHPLSACRVDVDVQDLEIQLGHLESEGQRHRRAFDERGGNSADGLIVKYDSHAVFFNITTSCHGDDS